jgi:hypothetical protein
MSYSGALPLFVNHLARAMACTVHAPRAEYFTHVSQIAFKVT